MSWDYDYSQIFHRKITAQTVAQLSWKILGPANRRFSLDENLLKLCKNLGDINQSAVRSFLIILKGVIMTPGSQQPVTRAGVWVWVGPGWSPPPLQLIRAEERQSVSAMGRAITPEIWWEHRVTVNVSEWDESWDVMWCDHGPVWHPSSGEVAEVSARVCAEPRYPWPDSPQSSRSVCF